MTTAQIIRRDLMLDGAGSDRDVQRAREQLTRDGYMPITGCFLGEYYHEFWSCGPDGLARVISVAGEPNEAGDCVAIKLHRVDRSA
jgi:hypothetical protein